MPLAVVPKEVVAFVAVVVELQVLPWQVLVAPAEQQVEARHTQEQEQVVLVVVVCTVVVDSPSIQALVAEPAEEVCTAFEVQVLVFVLEVHGKELEQVGWIGEQLAQVIGLALLLFRLRHQRNRHRLHP